MPCSDRGIGIEKKGAMHSIAIAIIRTIRVIGNRNLPWAAGGSET